MKIVDGENTVAEYEYDGAKRRTIKKTYSAGVLDETRHFYYTEPSKWQVLEERVDASSSADRQFVWGLRYVDDLVLRDRDTTGNGTLDERLYSLQDANWNVTSLASTDGTIQERHVYSAYGTPTVLTPAFAFRAASNHAWETRFAGYRFDSQIQFYHVRNRVLRAGLGWLQRDPAGYLEGFSLYEYAGDKPLDGVDAFGLLLGGDDFGAMVTGCLVNAGWSAVWSWFEGNSFKTGACKAGVECAVGLIMGELALMWPPAAGCIMGGLSAVGRQIAKAICTPCAEDTDCLVWAGLAGGLLGCLSGIGLSGVLQNEILEKIAGVGIGKLWTHNVSVICKDRLLEPK